MIWSIRPNCLRTIADRSTAAGQAEATGDALTETDALIGTNARTETEVVAIGDEMATGIGEILVHRVRDMGGN